jgi:hypothetical protein
MDYGQQQAKKIVVIVVIVGDRPTIKITKFKLAEKLALASLY